MTTQLDLAIPSEGSPRIRAGFWFLRGLALLAGGVLAAGGAEAEVSGEYQIKAAFLYNFTKFVEWPADGFPAGDAPLIIGVLGRNPFGDELEKVSHGRTVNGHRIVVIYLQTPAGANSIPISCHVLFVGAGDEALFARLARPAPGAGRLTVGESTAFSSTGMVTFVVVDDKVRFEINAEAAEHGGMKISAQLLKLATVVRRHP